MEFPFIRGLLSQLEAGNPINATHRQRRRGAVVPPDGLEHRAHRVAPGERQRRRHDFRNIEEDWLALCAGRHRLNRASARDSSSANNGPILKPDMHGRITP